MDRAQGVPERGEGGGGAARRVAVAVAVGLEGGGEGADAGEVRDLLADTGVAGGRERGERRGGGSGKGFWFSW